MGVDALVDRDTKTGLPFIATLFLSAVGLL